MKIILPLIQRVRSNIPSGRWLLYVVGRLVISEGLGSVVGVCGIFSFPSCRFLEGSRSLVCEVTSSLGVTVARAAEAVQSFLEKVFNLGNVLSFCWKALVFWVGLSLVLLFVGSVFWSLSQLIDYLRRRNRPLLGVY